MYLLYIYIYIHTRRGIHTYIHISRIQSKWREILGGKLTPTYPTNARWRHESVSSFYTSIFSVFVIFVQKFEKWREIFGAKNVHTHQRVVASTTRGGHAYIHTMCICTARTQDQMHTQFLQICICTMGNPFFARAHTKYL